MWLGCVQEIKQFKKPVEAVVLTMTAVCQMLRLKPERVKNPNGAGKVRIIENHMSVLLSTLCVMDILLSVISVINYIYICILI